jgi:hypothetical protein
MHATSQSVLSISVKPDCSYLGIFSPHDPGDLLTELIAFPFRSGAEAPGWERCVLDVMQGTATEIGLFMQRSTGSSMTGLVRERCLRMRQQR